MEVLTSKQAYRAMIFYLEKLYGLTNSDDLGGLLGGISLLKDGTTADPAAWEDWMESVNKALQTSDDGIQLKLS